MTNIRTKRGKMFSLHRFLTILFLLAAFPLLPRMSLADNAIDNVYVSCSGSQHLGFQSFFVDGDTEFRVPVENKHGYELTLTLGGFDSLAEDGASVTIDLDSFRDPDGGFLWTYPNGDIAPFQGDPSSAVDRTRRVKFFPNQTGVYTFSLKNAASDGQRVRLTCFDSTLYCKFNTLSNLEVFFEFVNTSSKNGSWQHDTFMEFYNRHGNVVGSNTVYPKSSGRQDISVNQSLRDANDDEDVEAYGVALITSTLPGLSVRPTVTYYRYNDDEVLVRSGEEECFTQGGG